MDEQLVTTKRAYFLKHKCFFSANHTKNFSRPDFNQSKSRILYLLLGYWIVLNREVLQTLESK